ncbi:Acetophenone carboxylase gamma subunit [Variovorax sp. PBL-H6]|uniref:hydantoinase/oxoprolinase family protein n=1 Tax=Variovorax sp. PBL-H6 TaxID=434009 RepID=UPI001319B59B|nr:hydantoinase/oxoprolinase family protein [Variovorax sp. PBL-H6]VTU25617.1 Acetophenone carboxylase gamma subunit [Variovorax sp. PBL-H6]
MNAKGQDARRYRIGVDIGGTFTDLVMFDTEARMLVNEKVPTTPDDPSRGVLNGIGLLLQKSGVHARDVDAVIHGTTLVANALIERKGVRTALVTTDGFRDVLQIGREWRYDIYDIGLQPVDSLIERSARFEVRERVGPEGEAITPLDERQMEALAQQLAAGDYEAVAVCFLHSYRFPAHEQRAKAILEKHLPHTTVCISSEVMPELGEYERSATAVCNAYVQPLFRKYIAGLIDGMRAMGIERELFLMQSDGGTVHYSTAMQYPIRLVQSGPAGGVQATALIGRLAGADNVLCFDMGGTTAKACLIEGGEPAVTTDFEVARQARFKKGSGIPLKVPAVDMIEVGSGGGSIARINQMGLIQVGPDSSSAVPGPACYGLGGKDGTVTDADLVLGYLDAKAFLGGDMALDEPAARQALAANIGQRLGLDEVEAAFGIHETVNETMAQAASIHALEKGRKAADYAMVPIGGAGPVHACHVALKLGIRRVVCPLGAGVASAFGFLASPMSFQFVRAEITPLAQLDAGRVRALVDELEAQGRAMFEASGMGSVKVLVKVNAAMRYVGQGFEVLVPLDDHRLARGMDSRLERAFEAAYQQLYGRTERGAPVEIVSWRVVVMSETPDITPAAVATLDDRGSALKGRRPVYSVLSRRFVDTPVYDRYRLGIDTDLQGPAIVEERESTVVVPEGARVTVDRYRNLIVDLPLQAGQ